MLARLGTAAARQQRDREECTCSLALDERPRLCTDMSATRTHVDGKLTSTSTGVRCWDAEQETSLSKIAKRITLPLHAPAGASRQQAKSNAIHDLIAGGVAGSAGVVIGHPMDSIKVKLQMASGTSGALQLTGLMRGIAAPFAMAAFVNASVFLTFGEATRFWDNYLQAGDERTKGEMPTSSCRENSVNKNFVCGAVTGVISSLILAPTEHIKCRMQAGREAYANSLDAGRRIWETRGICGLYRGLTATCLRQAPGFAVYFSCYDDIKHRLQRSLGESWAAPILAGGTAGSLSWAVVYPIDLIKSRIQVLPLDASKLERSMWNIARDIYQKGGWRSLYRGLGITVLRAFPVNGIIFPTYELTLGLLKNSASI